VFSSLGVALGCQAFGRTGMHAGLSRCGGALQPCPKPKKVGTAAVSLAWKLDDRAAPYTVPMKAVP
jgi:hypothetical protein